MAILSEDLIDFNCPVIRIQLCSITRVIQMAKTRYGNELHPLYTRWLSTTQRCTNPKHPSFRNYGAKGISLSEELRSFEDYRDYVSSLPGYDPENGSLDRIDNRKGYEKNNLRWATQSIQVANQLSSGKGHNRFSGVNWSCVHKRWIARVHYEGKSLFSRSYRTEEEALEARNTFILENNLPHTIQSIE